eukprot:g18284.t1
MKERLLFHLRLGDSSSPPLARRKSLIGVQSASIWSAPGLLQPEGVDEEPPLVCTCVHSSSVSAVAVGFKRGVVHVYHRQEDSPVYGRSRRGSEEEKWYRSVLYPTRALGSDSTSPIGSPSAAMPPDIACVAVSPGGDKLAVGTSDGFVFVTQAPPPLTGGSGIAGTGWARGAGFHHKSHRGKRINCLLWDDSGDRLFSVCEGGTVVVARNLRPRRGAPAVGVAGITGVMQFFGVHQEEPASSCTVRSEPAVPQAIIVGQTESPGVSLDLGRTGAALPGGATRSRSRGYVQCDVLLVMTRKRAVLLYFVVGEDVSAVAPHQTFVDLNVVEHAPPTDTRHSRGSPATRTRTPPPNLTDLGACLWGPPQMPNVGRSSPGPSIGINMSEVRRRERGSSRPDCDRDYTTPDKDKGGTPRRGDDALAAATPRPVLFAYVAQPGGRLWRIGLSDGEVESMHRPRVEVDEDRDRGGEWEEKGGVSSAGGGGVELGYLRAVDVGDARALLCWRTGNHASKTAGEFALLDPNTHTFVASWPGASGIVDVSGYVLSPCSKSEEGNGTPDHHQPTLNASLAVPVPIRRRLEVLGGGVRVLHGGDLAKVTMLYHNAEGEAWSSSSSEITAADGWAAALSAETAARRVQRAWRARVDRKALAAGVRAGLAGAAAAAGVGAVAAAPSSSSTASRASPLQLRMPGDFPRRARKTRTRTGIAAAPVSVRDVAAGEAEATSDAGTHADSEGPRFQKARGATAASASSTPASTSSASRRRKRSNHDGDGDGDRASESHRGGVGSGSGSGSGSRGRKKTRSRFSVRDSLEALDAADRALRLSDSRQGGVMGRAGAGGPELWPSGTSPSLNTGETDLSGGATGEAGGAGLSGSESDGANAMCRATDALIRETWPVLHKTRSRSLQAFSSPPESPPFRSKPASFPTDGRVAPVTALAMAAAAAAAAGAGGRAAEEEEQGSGGKGGDASEARMAAGCDQDGDREGEGEAVTTRGSSPVEYPSNPSSPSWKGHPDTGERPKQHRERSSTGSEAGAFGPQSALPSVHSSVPFPRGSGGEDRHRHHDRDRDGPSRPTSPTPAEQSEPSTSSHQHGNLFGLGTILQRTVQAMQDGLQPGGGATSDDSLLGGEEDPAMFADQNSGGSGGGFDFSSGNEDDPGADGGTTSDTGKNSWGVSSDRSELLDSSRSNSVATTATMRLSSGGMAMAGADGDKAMIGSSDMGPGGSGKVDGDGGGGRRSRRRRSEGEKEKLRNMLLVSGMMGVKRNCLGTLRSRRETRLRAKLASVTDLPPSAMDDHNPFIPPSQYEVRLNVSRGLGLSLNITGNEVRVKGFSPINGDQIGPAQACGEIQVGDALVCVNHERLTLLNHENVVRVLRGLLNTSGSQVLLLRFACSEDSTRLLPPPPPPPLPPKTPKPVRHSSLGNPQSEPHLPHRGGGDGDGDGASAGKGAEEEAFRPESWHGSRRPQGSLEGGPGGIEGGLGRSASALPRHASDPTRVRSNSIGGDSPKSLQKGGGSGSGREEGGKMKMMARDGDGAEEKGSDLGLGLGLGLGGVDRNMAKGKRRGELWGEGETGLAGGRHVYLGDMGNAGAQKTLQSIANDVQWLHQVRQSSEQCRFFQGNGRVRQNLTDPSPASLEHRIPPPSKLLAPPPLASFSASAATPSPSTPPLASGIIAPYYNSLQLAQLRPDEPPPLPKELYRGRRRRRPRRRRSSMLVPLSGGVGGREGDGRQAEADGAVIDLRSCQEVVQAELGRLEGELEIQAARLDRRSRRSGARSLVTKMLLHKSGFDRSTASALLLDLSPSPTTNNRGRRQRGSTSSSRRGNRKHPVVAGSRRNEAGGDFDTDGDLTDSDHDDSTAAAAAAGAGSGLGIQRIKSSDGGERGKEETTPGHGHGLRYGLGGDGSDAKEVLDDEEVEGTCDIILEAVSTDGLQEELQGHHAFEVLGVDPPRPLPSAAYDLQTALESVQHFATQTLAGVVQAEATRGSTDYSDPTPSSGGRSPRQMGRAAKAAAKESREAGVAGGLVERWEDAWPPRELTKELGLVTARQMGHVMRCDAEPLIQIWMRCFTPVDVKHRGKLWGGLAPHALHSQDLDLDVYDAGRWHRQLVCGLVTLFAQVHMSWPFLARPSDEPHAVGLLSLRLETTWFSTLEDGIAGQGQGQGQAAESPSSGVSGAVSGADSIEEWGQASGGRRGPQQWDEEKAVLFIQDYGAYLEADAIAAAASCREMEWALQEVLHLAEQCGDYKSNERVLNQLLRGAGAGARTPSMAMPNPPTLRSPMLGRSPMFGPTPNNNPARSPANSSSGGIRTPGNWTPTILSPRSPGFQAYPSSASNVSINANVSSGSAYPYPNPHPYSLSSGGVSTAAARGGGSGSGSGSGGIDSAFDAMYGALPMEEDAVRKALGLRPAGSAATEGAHGDYRHGAGEGGNQGHREGDVGGFEGQDGGVRAEDGGADRSESESESERRYSQVIQAPGRAPLCLLLSKLGELFRWDAAAAADICADAFPGVRPWNVHHALHKEQHQYHEKAWNASEPTTPVNRQQHHHQHQQQQQGRGSPRRYSCSADDDSGTRNDAAFHAYLWAIMRKHPRECRRDWKVIQRCLQLSLRLSTKLRSLPPDHSLQAFCKAATRKFKPARHSADPAPSIDTRGRGSSGLGFGVRGRHPEAFSTDVGSPFSSPNPNRNPRDGRWRRPAGGGVDGFMPMRMRDLRVSVEDIGGATDGDGDGDGDDAVWRRYSEVVHEVVSVWCRDVHEVDLDPLWLLPKLRTHKAWRVAFQVCAAISCSWEEEQQREEARIKVVDNQNDNQRSSGPGLASVLSVFDTLADACFASFDDGDAGTLSQALNAVWAADGTLRRVAAAITTVTAVATQAETARPPDDGGEEREDYDGVVALAGPSSDAGSGSGDARSSGYGISVEWVEDSRMVGIVRSLAQRCPGHPADGDTRAEQQGVDDGGGGRDGDGGGEGGDASGNRGGSSTEGVRESMASEEPGGGAALPVGALSLVELGGAVLDAVGPEATGEVLAACPQLLNGMPPKFFCDMADRQAALCEQQALEASLLRQATAQIWSARGRATGKAKGASGGKGGGLGIGMGMGMDIEGLKTRTNPLGPRLSWLACEELTSFFQHNTNPSTGAANARGRLRGYSSNSSDIITSPTESPLSLLRPPIPRSRHHHHSGGLFGIGTESSHISSAFDGSGGIGIGIGAGVSGGEDAFLSMRKEGLELNLIRNAARMELNLVLPGGAHAGTLLDPTWPCGLCGLALALSPSADVLDGDSYSYGYSDAIGADGASRGGDADMGMAFRSPPGSVLHGGEEADVDDVAVAGMVVKVKACGCGYHARCLASASTGGMHWWGGGGSGSGGEDMELLHLPCPWCT